MRNRKWLVLGVVAVVFVVLFVVGFVSTYIGARDDKAACEKITPPAGAVTVRVQRRQTETSQSNDVERLCVWVDRHGSTIRERKLP
jgi:hypothetical protein